MPQTQGRNLGESLFDCHRLQKKMQSLKNEIDNHEPWIDKICANGQELIDEGHESSAEFQQKINELQNTWRVTITYVDDSSEIWKACSQDFGNLHCV